MPERQYTWNDRQWQAEEGLSAADILAAGGIELTADTVAAKYNDDLIELSRTLTEGGSLEPVELDSEDGLEVMRHTAAHVMAQAILRVFPEAKLAIGPTVENGFYYDIDFGDKEFSSSDFKRIQSEMQKIVKKKFPIERKEVSRDEALAMWEPEGEIYKVELIQDLPEGETISTYTQGEFTDLCRGPHTPHTGFVRAFKLMSVAGAYWRGDEKRQQLTRIYGTAWPTKDALKDYLHRLEEAEKRDHRKLAKQLELFMISEEAGKGLPLWMPNGTIIREELEKLAKEKEFDYGYERVATPHITRQELYFRSGHLPYYKDSMFPPLSMKDKDKDEDEVFYLKPMNCPHHHMIYAARPRSYRELPLRLSEYGQVYRYEKSGELAGILRVRGMCMNDAHLYVREDQLKEEFQLVMQMHKEYYELFGLKDYYMRLSLGDPEDDKKYFKDDALWRKAEKICAEAMDAAGMNYKTVRGEAAFYGPKVDVQFKNVMGREETNGTNQVDFLAAERFNLRYIGSDGQEHKPVVLHRAPLGTHERFIAFLIEHFAGAFPLWMSPKQVVVIPVAAAFADYAHKLSADLRAARIRSEVDDSTETLNKRIRTAITHWKTPCVLVVGEREMTQEAVTLRQYGIKEQKQMPYTEFKAWALEQIRTRALPDREL